MKGLILDQLAPLAFDISVLNKNYLDDWYILSKHEKWWTLQTAGGAALHTKQGILVQPDFSWNSQHIGFE